MTTMKITLGMILLFGIMCVNNPAISLTAAGVALGWAWYESRKAKEARQ